VGARRQRELLRRFGSLRKVREASLDELAAAPGMNRSAALAVKRFFDGGTPLGEPSVGAQPVAAQEPAPLADGQPAPVADVARSTREPAAPGVVEGEREEAVEEIAEGYREPAAEDAAEQELRRHADEERVTAPAPSPRRRRRRTAARDREDVVEDAAAEELSRLESEPEPLPPGSAVDLGDETNG
jgi:hypothetical protein